MNIFMVILIAFPIVSALLFLSAWMVVASDGAHHAPARPAQTVKWKEEGAAGVPAPARTR